MMLLRAVKPVLIFILLIAATAAAAAAELTCKGEWQSAALTNYESYPDPGSVECVKYNGCKWAGQFYGVRGKKSENWVSRTNIAAVHQKHWRKYGGKSLRLRQSGREITVKVLDLCSDSDCSGCCSKNLGGDGYLIDIEKHTMQRFGSGSGEVKFQICS